MPENNLVVTDTKRRRYSSHPGEMSAPVKYVVARDFRAYALNKKWLTDTTEFHVPARKVHLSPIIDCFDGLVVSSTIETSPDTGLVNTMLDAAVAGLPDADQPVIHRSQASTMTTRRIQVALPLD